MRNGRTGRLAALALAGTLSVGFGEVQAGSSQMWFAEAWGLAVVFPLYLSHLVLFLAVGIAARRVTLAHLYLLGALFGLYEAVITKVLWAGYAGETGPGWGHLMGLAMPETLILVGFWHPVMSFIAPVLAFQVLGGQGLEAHRPVLTRRRWKTALALVWAIFAGAFVAFGSHYDPARANGAVLGTFALVAALAMLNRRALPALVPGRPGWVLLATVLAVLYVGGGASILPQRLPHGLVPYLSVAAVYALAIAAFRTLPPAPVALRPLGSECYRPRHLAGFALVLLAATNLWLARPGLGRVALTVGYLALIPLAGLFLALVARRFSRRTAPA